MRGLWELAVSDAGFPKGEIELCWLPGPGRTGAWYCPPGIALPSRSESGLTTTQAAQLSSAGDKHRVAVFAGGHRDEADLVAAMRHELQHAVQYEEHGAELMYLAELLRRAIAEAYGGTARDMVQAATPMERQAHQASLALVARSFGAESLTCGTKRLLELCGRTSVEIDMQFRTVAFAALHREHLDGCFVAGRSAQTSADALVPGAWAQLVANDKFASHSTRAARLHPSAREVAEADKPGRPWLPVVTALLEGEDFGCAELTAV